MLSARPASRVNAASSARSPSILAIRSRAAALVGDEDVLGLQVAVDDVVLMGLVEGGADLVEQLRRHLERQFPVALDERPQVLVVCQFHD